MSSNQGSQPEESREELLATTTEQLQAKLKAIKIDISRQEKQLASLKEKRASQAKLIEHLDAFVNLSNNMDFSDCDKSAMQVWMTKVKQKKTEVVIEKSIEYAGYMKGEDLLGTPPRERVTLDDYMKKHDPEHVFTKLLQKQREEAGSERVD